MSHTRFDVDEKEIPALAQFVPAKRFCLLPVLFVCLGISWGCSNSDGPTRYIISGKVTLDGKPCPVGEIFFEPDASQGNSGPGARARIVNSQYQTPENMGITPGPHKVNIVASDGVATEASTDGTPLTTKIYTTEVTIPAEDASFDFDVPPSHLVQ